MDEKMEQMQDESGKLDIGILLHDFFRGFKKYWWIPAVLTVLVALYSFISSVRAYTPLYKSEASFTVTTSSSGNSNYSYQFYYDQSAVSQMAATFPYILDSDLLTDLIRQDLGVEYLNGSISASAVSGSNLFTISVVSANAEDALEILESTIQHYPEVAEYVIGDIRFNMIDAPELAQEPYNSFSGLHGMVNGAVKGFLLGAAILMVYALTRRTIRKEEEIKEKLNAQCLGIVPKIEFKKRSRRIDETLSIFNENTGEHFKESIRGIALRLRRQMDEKGEKVLLVTSALSGEGCTTVSRNLAYALAGMGKKVILLDADLRKQDKRGNKRGNAAGLENFLLGRCSLSDVLIRDHDTHIWTVGCSRAMTAQEILHTANNLRSLIAWMKKNVDYVVIDAPDCTRMSITGLMAENADTALFVIQQDYAKVYRIMSGIEDVTQYNMTFAGCVLNQTQVGITGYGYGKYGKYYGKYAYSRYGGYGRYGSYGKYGYGQNRDSGSGSARASGRSSERTERRNGEEARRTNL